jgi:hypothetical protein
LFSKKDLLSSPLGLQWTSPHLVILTISTAVKLNGFPQWQHLSRNNEKNGEGTGGLLKLSREQHFTVVLLANVHPNVYVSCSPILKLPPLYHTTCLLLLIKSLTSCTSRDTNLSKTVQRTAMRAPNRTQEPEDPAPYKCPLPQEAAKETDASPQFLILSPYPHYY